MSRHIAGADLPVSAQELETRVLEITTQARKEGLNGAVALTVIFSNFDYIDGWIVDLLRELWPFTYKISKYNHKF